MQDLAEGFAEDNKAIAATIDESLHLLFEPDIERTFPFFLAFDRPWAMKGAGDRNVLG